MAAATRSHTLRVPYGSDHTCQGLWTSKFRLNARNVPYHCWQYTLAVQHEIKVKQWAVVYQPYLSAPTQKAANPSCVTQATALRWQTQVNV